MSDNYDKKHKSNTVRFKSTHDFIDSDTSHSGESDNDCEDYVDLNGRHSPLFRSTKLRQDLSFSVFIDNKRIIDDKQLGCTPPERDFVMMNLSNIYPKETKKWIDGTLVINCQKCSVKFGLLNRKHHCRACGGVFCNDCCCKYIVIPEKYIHKPQEDDTYIKRLTNATKWFGTVTDNNSRVCDECFNKINNLNKITNIILLCENLILNGKLDISMLHKILIICKDWCSDWYNAGIHQLSKFRAIQYIYPSDLYSSWDIQLLWSSRKSLIGHNNWITCLIKSVIQHYYDTKNPCRIGELKEIILIRDKVKSCWNLMCSRKCNIDLDILDYIEVFKFVLTLEKTNYIFWKDINLKGLMLYLLEKLYFNKEFDDVVIRCVIPLFCSVLSELMNCLRDDIDFEFVESMFNLFTVEQGDPATMMHFLSEINYLDSIALKSNGALNLIKFMKSYLKKILGDKIVNQLHSMKTTLVNIMNNENVADFKPILYPFDFCYLIAKIHSIEKIKSNTCPLLVIATIIKNEKESKESPKVVKFIIKKDTGLRKEKIVSCLITLLQYKLYQQALRKRIAIFDKIPTYKIDMITHNIGVIEFVENSVTLRMINETGLTLQNYVLENNPSDKIETVKKRFSNSLAISSCLSYILGLGDRHLDNIMINKKGLIFHIDYGYLMDNPVTSILSAPNIKVTSVMIDFLGGPNGIYYEKFKEYVIKVYDIMRLYKNIIVSYYEMIAIEKFIDWDTFRDKLESRFMDGMTCEDVEIALVNEIETSNSYSSVFSDLCHHYRKKVSELFVNKS